MMEFVSMHKVAALTAGLLLAASVAPAVVAADSDAIPADHAPKAHVTGALPSLWVLRGDNAHEYSAGTDETVTFAGKPSGFIKSIGFNLDGFGTMATRQSAAAFRGKTVRLSALVKTERVQRWALLWIGYDTPTRPFMPAGATRPDFDLMRFTQSLVGTLDWQNHQLDLPLPADADMLYFGIVLSGRGTAYVNKVALDVVEPLAAPSAPSLDFAPRR
jgi:hypothetical protein